MAINEVLEREDDDETLRALQNPAACLVDIQSENGPRYQVTLLHLKREKTAKSGAQMRVSKMTMLILDCIFIVQNCRYSFLHICVCTSALAKYSTIMCPY